MKSTRIAFLGLFFFLAAGDRAFASSLDANVIAMFPANVVEFSYIDVQHAREFPWYAQLKMQAVPPRFIELEQYLAAANINTGALVSGIAWAETSNANTNGSPPIRRPASGFVGIALGDFDPEIIRAALKSKKQEGVLRGDFTIYGCGPSCDGLSFAVVDSGVIAFGAPEALEGLLDAKSGATETLVGNEGMMESIHDVNRDLIFWTVVGESRTRQAIAELVPELRQFSQADKLLKGVKSVAITADSTDTIDVGFEILTASPEDAAALGQLVQLGLTVREYQARQSGSGMTEMLDTVRIAESGTGVKITLSASTDQMIALVQHGAFAN